MPMAGKGILGQGSEKVVEKHAGPDVDSLPDPMSEGVQERHRLHEVGAYVVEHEIPLCESLAHQAEVELLQVPEATVEELR
jgi:hypothetical protein